MNIKFALCMVFVHIINQLNNYAILLNFELNMILSKQQIQSLLAGFICMLIYGSSYTYGTLIPFVTSYIYYSSTYHVIIDDQTITTNKMASLLLISILILNFGMPLSNIKQLQFSNRITTLISIIGVCGSLLGASFGNSFWTYLIFYGIFFGVFIGFGYLAPIKNCYEHIPQYKGRFNITKVNE